jgi:hypothetical protein
MATEEIQYVDDELQAIYSEVRRGIALLSSMQGTTDKMQEKYSHLTARISRARNAFQSFKVELKELRGQDKKLWQPVSAFLMNRCGPVSNVLCSNAIPRKRRSTTSP